MLIINALGDGPMSVTDLCRALGLSQTNVSQYLAILRERSVVTSERVGANLFYSLRGDKVLGAVDLLREFMADTIARHSAVIGAPAKVPRRTVSQQVESLAAGFRLSLERTVTWSRGVAVLDEPPRRMLIASHRTGLRTHRVVLAPS